MKHTIFLKAIVMLLVVVTFVQPLTVGAVDNGAVMPCASYYLDAYNTYICAVGNGDIQIWFEVMATDDMDELGTLRIMLYESTDNVNWTWKTTFLHEDNSQMLLKNDFWYMNYVPYDGVAGRYYKAYVCIWAGKNGSGDTRYMWATSVRAT